MKKVLIVLVALVVLAGIAGGGAFFWMDSQVNQAAAAPGAPPVEFTVPKGATGKGLGRQLEEKGLISGARVWQWALYRRGGLSAKAGRHSVSPSMTVEEIAKALEGAPLPDDIPFTVVEGWRLRDTDAALVEAGLIKPGAYIAAAHVPGDFTAPFPLPADSLEGYLYPETYSVVREGFDVKKLLQRQLDKFAERFYTPNKDAIAASGRSLHELVIMASMLEREEPVPAQRTIVSGILWKRIDKGFPLGVDATSRYQLAQWNDRVEFLKHLRDENDPWNTRHKKGLPPGPIGAPTVDSLMAALTPEKNEFWYYLHDSEHHLHPSRNAEEHEALRKKFNVY